MLGPGRQGESWREREIQHQDPDGPGIGTMEDYNRNVHASEEPAP